MDIIILAVTGFFSGVVSGMGIGGGVILIPILTLILGFEQKTAQGINLLYFIPTAIVALCVHWKNHCVMPKVAIPIASYGIVSAVIGAILTGMAAPALLRRIFAVLIIVVGINEFYIAVKNK
ncbi:MAG: sulfite exporter TauE/SafE family protein [Clostridiaceae bacterium]|jgi:uncharacterized membrane protein YfcA|nr:sulfite exporter TauE/SafE family protein [Clostridiaceae bacterium]